MFFSYILIGISLSMDAFSLALLYGTCGLSFKRRLMLSFIVSFFHFFMPLIGLCFGNVVMNYLVVNANLLVGVVFFVIGIEMILSIKDNTEVKIFSSFFGYLLFGFTVSIDSLTTGFGLSLITSQYILICFIFMVLSGSFTYMGVWIGKKVNDNFGKYATFFGGIMMILLGIFYLFTI